MGRTLARFPVGLEAEAKLSQQPADQFLAGAEATLSQRTDKVALASTDPQQRRFGIARDRRLHKLFQRRQ